MFIVERFEMKFSDTPSVDIPFTCFFFDGVNKYSAYEVARGLLDYNSLGYLNPAILSEALLNTIQYYPENLTLEPDTEIALRSGIREENISVFFKLAKYI